MTTPRIIVVGNLNVDQIMGPLPPWPRPGTEAIVPHYELRVGGSAGNTVLALGALKVPSLLVSNVGDDLFADWLRDGVDVEKVLRREQGPTTVSVGVTHPNGERTFITNEGHIALLDRDFVMEALERHLSRGSHVLFCGAYLMPNLAEAYPEIFAFIHARGAHVALDTGWPPEGWTPAARAALSDWSGTVDHLLSSEAEIMGAMGDLRLDDAAQRLRAGMREDAVLVVKQGPDGAAAWSDEGHRACPAPRVPVVDTIGAGDVFNAGYLAALTRGATLADALRLGVETASRAISTHPRRY